MELRGDGLAGRGGESALYCTVLYCTALYCTVLQVSLAPLDPLVTVVQPQAASCCALLNTAAGCEVGAAYRVTITTLS